MLRLLYILVFILLALAANGQTVYKDEVGKPFPVRQFVTIDGEQIDSTYLKNKIVFFNFYFDACMACRVEMKGLNELFDKYTNDETVFIAITPDNAEKAKQTREQYGLKFKIVSLQGKEITELKKVSNYPTNIIVDKAGNIAFKESGTVIPEYWTTKHVLEVFGEVIEKLKSN